MLAVKLIVIRLCNSDDLKKMKKTSNTNMYIQVVFVALSKN